MEKPEEDKCAFTKILSAVTYGYLILPFLIFAVGWFRIRFWVPIVICLFFCTWRCWKETASFWKPDFTKDSIFKIMFVCVILAVWVYYSGIGGKVFQNADHSSRNAIFEALVRCRWPIYNTDIDTEMYQSGTVTSLIYYIGFWMPAAVVGKVFGMQMGYLFQMIWAFIGLFLVYYYICERKKKIMVWPLFLLIFFSGLDIAGVFMTGTNIFQIENDMHMEWWASPYQYSSVTTQLFWVFNQSVPAWLCTVFAMQQKNNRSLVFIIASAMFSATFPFVGLLVIALFWIFTRQYGIREDIGWTERFKEWIKAFTKDTITVQNVLGGGILGIFTYLYQRGNTSATKISSQGFLDILRSVEWTQYLIFILLEVGIYLIFIYEYNKKNGIYYVVVLSLVFIPLLKGSSVDFCMRVSIPALFILMILVQDTLEKSAGQRDWMIFISLSVALCIGSMTPIHEMERTVQHTVESKYYGNSLNVTLSQKEILNAGNFSGDVKGNLFFEHIAKKYE